MASRARARRLGLASWGWGRKTCSAKRRALCLARPRLAAWPAAPRRHMVAHSSAKRLPAVRSSTGGCKLQSCHDNPPLETRLRLRYACITLPDFGVTPTIPPFTFGSSRHEPVGCPARATECRPHGCSPWGRAGAAGGQACRGAEREGYSWATSWAKSWPCRYTGLGRGRDRRDRRDGAVAPPVRPHGATRGGTNRS